MRKTCNALAAGLLALCACAAFAGPADYVHTPTVEYGEREIELKAGRASFGDGSHEQAAKIGFGLGATPWWFTEVYVGFEGASGESTKYEAVEWENIFQLTERGRYPFEAGVLLEIERPRDHAEGWELTYGPLLQTELARLQLNGNLLFESHARAEAPSDTELRYEWQAKYRWRPAFEFGLQGFGELGPWDHWDPAAEQSRKLGPAVFGKVPLGGRQALRYDAAYLVGTSAGAADRTLRLRVEYEF
jgi:hypothetical protein